MFVELGSTSNIWRAHIVRGILASHGIDIVLWHEHAVHLYGSGWGARCLVLAIEDDVDDAREILRAAPEPEPEATAARESDQLHDVAPPQIYPGIVALLVTGVMLSLGILACNLLVSFVVSFMESGTTPPDSQVLESLPGLLFGAIEIGFGWGLLMFVFLGLLQSVPELVKTAVCIVMMPALIIVPLV